MSCHLVFSGLTVAVFRSRLKRVSMSSLLIKSVSSRRRSLVVNLESKVGGERNQHAGVRANAEISQIAHLLLGHKMKLGRAL